MNEVSKQSANSKAQSNFPSFPVKRNRRVYSMDSESMTKARSNNKRPKKSNDTENNDVMPQVIALNCKLVTETLSLKRALFEKNDSFTKMQEKFYEKEIEHIKSKALIEKYEKEILDLKNTIETLKEAQFCTDLIQFDDDSIQSESTF